VFEPQAIPTLMNMSVVVENGYPLCNQEHVLLIPSSLKQKPHPSLWEMG